MKYTKDDIFEGIIISCHDGTYEYMVTNINGELCTLTGLKGDLKTYPNYKVSDTLDMLNTTTCGENFIKNKLEVYEIY